MIPISKPLLTDGDKQAVLEVLHSGQLAQGPRVRAFEEQFAAWAGVKHAIAVSSGTAALHLALLAHGFGPGDEIITTPFSFVASANCILYVGARPVFADIEPDYFTLDPEPVERCITPLTKAIVLVHLYGQPCNMAAFADLARRHNLTLIEDACQAHGARFGGQMVGAWGTACYSFYATKNMMTGEGGMLTTNDDEIARLARLWREHGSPKRYVHDMLGYNLRLTDMQAALGLSQLARLEAYNAQRQSNAAYLSQQLRGAPHVQVPALRPNAQSVFHQYTIRAQDRAALIARLTERGIGYGIYYPGLIPQQPVYQAAWPSMEHFPRAEQAAQEALSLPVHPALTQADLEAIVAAVKGD